MDRPLSSSAGLFPSGFSEAALASLAVGQRSLGPDRQRFPLFPVMYRGVPKTAPESWDYPLEVEFNYAAVDPALLQQPPLAGLKRWTPLLPPLVPALDMGEGGTPLIPLPSRVTGHDGAVYLKDESRNPTWSHKDRLNLCTVSAAVHGGANGVVAASSGNHGASTAAYAARAGLPCVVFVPSEISRTFLSMIRAYGACAVPVETEHRWPLVEAVATRAGYQPTSNVTPFHTGHPFGPEGYKTIAYELFVQLGAKVPGTVVVPTGYGELLFGIAKGFSELLQLGLTTALPRMCAVEPAARAPLHHAMQTNAPMANVPAADSRLSSIACTASGYRGMLAVRDSVGSALVVDDAATLEAQDKLSRIGIWQELSSCAAIASLKQVVRSGHAGPIVVLGTSSGFKDPGEIVALPTVEPTFEQVAAYVWQTSGMRML